MSPIGKANTTPSLFFTDLRYQGGNPSNTRGIFHFVKLCRENTEEPQTCAIAVLLIRVTLMEVVL